MPDTVGQVNLRAENVERVVKGFAELEYKFLQAVTVQSSSSWIESYYRETGATLTAGATENIKGVARGAQPPSGEPSWTKVSSYIDKYMFDGYIYEEDILTDAFDIQARTLRKVSQAVTGSVDGAIWDDLTEDRTVVNINNVTIASGSEWDSATAANQNPLGNILSAMQLIAEDNYTEVYQGGFLFVSPKGYADLMNNATVRNASQTVNASDQSNGRMGRILGLTIVVSNNVTVDYAAVTAGKIAATWKEVQPLKVDTSYTDVGVRYRVRAWQYGITQLVNPGAVCLITNTQA